MSIVVIGGTGRIGSKVVRELNEHGLPGEDAQLGAIRFEEWLGQTAPSR